VSRQARIILKVAVWGVALSPLMLLVYRFFTDGLGANPISYATHLLGDTTLRLLLASLAMTPIRLLFGIAWQMSLRRLLGLFASSTPASISASGSRWTISLHGSR